MRGGRSNRSLLESYAVMKKTSADVTVTSANQIGTPIVARPPIYFFALVAGAAFALYWFSSFFLQSRNGTMYFGADTQFYAVLAEGNAIDRIARNYHLDRIVRFHPTTVVMATAWMKIFHPLTQWVAPHHLLKAMFAAVGALGVWAAMSAFAAVISRGYATLFGMTYAVSFGVWYFSSIEESKIVTASLSALYIASFLHLRKRWTMRGVLFLTAILLLACLNEIVSCFLIIIALVDTLMRRGWNFRHSWWIAVHGLVIPIAFVILEGVIKGRLLAAGAHPEGESHFRMLIFYVSRNDYSAASLYSFVVNWLFFNVAAPTPDARHAIVAWPDYKGYFEPSLANYFSNPVSVSLIALFAVMVIACVLPRYRGETSGALVRILMALLSYTIFRGAFFLIFNPAEAILFSPAVTLAHMLMISIPFASSSFPAKGVLLALIPVLLFVNNGFFILR